MAINDLFRCTFEQNVGNHPASWQLGFKQTGETGNVDLELSALCALAVVSDFDSLKFALSSTTTLEAVKCRKLTGDPNPLAQVKIQNAKGLVSGDAVPLVKSLLVTHKQNTANVRRNGKSYLPGIPESVCDEGRVTDNDTIDGVKMIFDAMLQTTATIPEGSADFRMVVLSYPNGPSNPPVGLDVVSNSVQAILYNSQRRRTREYGYSTVVI